MMPGPSGVACIKGPVLHEDAWLKRGTAPHDGSAELGCPQWKLTETLSLGRVDVLMMSIDRSMNDCLFNDIKSVGSLRAQIKIRKIFKSPKQ